MFDGIVAPIAPRPAGLVRRGARRKALAGRESMSLSLPRCCRFAVAVLSFRYRFAAALPREFTFIAPDLCRFPSSR